MQLSPSQGSKREHTGDLVSCEMCLGAYPLLVRCCYAAGGLYAFWNLTVWNVHSNNTLMIYHPYSVSRLFPHPPFFGFGTKSGVEHTILCTQREAHYCEVQSGPSADGHLNYSMQTSFSTQKFNKLYLGWHIYPCGTIGWNQAKRLPSTACPVYMTWVCPW